MHAILAIVAPVFCVIFAGWLAARSGYLSAEAGKILSEFAFKIAMPALLFRAMLQIGEIPGTPWKLVAAYYGAILLVWPTAALLTRFVLRRPAADGASIAMGSCFGNTVMLGIPLGLSAFGPEAAAPIALLISLDTPILWILATFHVEWAERQGGAGALANAKAVAFDLIRNPIVSALVLGTAWRLSGLAMPEILDKPIALVAQGAVPSALFALGMTLAAFQIKGQFPTLAAICILKMLLLPVFVTILAVYVLALPPLWAAIAVLFAAMPVGANAYLFAARYDRAVRSVSAAIAISTALAIVTVSLVLYLVGAPVGSAQ
ncbi:MAG: AEC family transporter [Hyphomicrobiaceae bacterium]